jgi:hypothetical protein
MRDYGISVSKGNRKLGNIPNVSLPPVITCLPDAPCVRDCYARKAYRLYPQTRAAWDANLALYLSSPASYFASLSRFLSEHASPYFRYHASGDIPDENYYSNMRILADAHPSTRFLCYTRKVDIVRQGGPCAPNLVMMISSWIDETRGEEYPVFQVIPKHAIYPYGLPCPGACSSCRACYHARAGDLVTIEKH